MTRALQVAHLALILCGVGLCAFVAYLAYGVTREVDQTLETVNRPCATGKPCGTLADFAKTLNTVRLTFGQVEIAANHEDRNLSTLDAQEQALFAATQKTLQNAQGALGTAQTAIASIQSDAAAARPVIASLSGITEQVPITLNDLDSTETAATTAIQSLNAKITDPRLNEILTSSQQITWNASEVTFDATRVADDATKKYFTPQPWYRKALPYAATGAKIAAYALPWP